MPWQRDVADIGGEINPETGLPAYRQIFVTVPRQSGKTTLFLSFQVHRCQHRRWVQPQRSVYTAQTGQDARDKWRDEIEPLLAVSRFKGRYRPRWQNGSERIRWTNGSLIMLMSSSTSAGHGKTIHQATLDEVFADQDDRREAGLRPAMVTIQDAQLLVCSTAGTDASTVYNRKVINGRRSVAEDRGSGLAYFEYAAPDGWDPDDEESYFGFMPALCPDPPCRCGDGNWRHTVTLDVIRAERADMEPAEFRRAYGNRPTAGADVVIPADVWRRVCHPTAKPGALSRFALDVSEDRAMAAIVAATDGGAVELVEQFIGLRGVVDACNALVRKHRVKIALDFGGPAGVFADSIEQCERLTGPDVIRACGAMFDAIVENRVKFRAEPEAGDPFTDAVMGSVKKPVGDQWVWSRKKSATDVTPLMAATLAWRPLKTTEPFMLRGR